jgi:hypothetical protein
VLPRAHDIASTAIDDGERQSSRHYRQRSGGGVAALEKILVFGPGVDYLEQLENTALVPVDVDNEYLKEEGGASSL